MLSVICPIYNEERYIAQFLDSILEQDYPKDDLEVLLVDGMSTDATRRMVAAYIERYPFIRLLDNPRKIVPVAMNIGIRNACGEVIMRLDAHAAYPSDYFSTLVRRVVELEADNVGTVCRTDVLHKNAKTLAIREVLCNKFGVGNSTFRTGVDEVREVDTVPFGCWPRSVFDRFGMFDERLIRNQDFELNGRIIRGGGKICIVPDTYCTYYARENFRDLWDQNYKNGLWGIRTVKFTGRAGSLALRHYIPMIFVLSLLLPAVGGLLWWPIWLFGALSIVMYLLALGGISLMLCISKRLNFLYLLSAFATLHISNGCGMLVSLFTANGYVRKVNNALK